MDHRFNGIFSDIYEFISNNIKRIVIVGMLPTFVALSIASAQTGSEPTTIPQRVVYVDSIDSHVNATTTTSTTTTTTTTVPETTTSTTTTVPDQIQGFDVNNYHCPEFYDLAMQVGWEQKHWPKLSHIIYRESRCHPDSWNRADPGTGSRGLTQINSFWCTPNKNNPTGFLQANGALNTCDDLFRPRVSLKASLVIFQRSGWNPWGG